MISSTDELSRLLRRLADREQVRSEATVQADVRQLLLTGAERICAIMWEPRRSGVTGDG